MLLTTFLLTVFIDLTVAVQVGVVLAAFLFIKRMADVTNVAAVTRELTDAPDGTMSADADGVARRTIPAGVEVYEVNGPFFFGAADKIKDVLHFVARKPRVFILRMRNVPVIDASGIRVLDDLFRSFSPPGDPVRDRRDSARSRWPPSSGPGASTVRARELRRPPSTRRSGVRARPPLELAGRRPRDRGAGAGESLERDGRRDRRPDHRSRCTPRGSARRPAGRG